MRDNVNVCFPEFFLEREKFKTKVVEKSEHTFYVQ